MTRAARAGASAMAGDSAGRGFEFEPETWRYRVGGYRFFYEIDENRKIIFMIAAETRQKAY